MKPLGPVQSRISKQSWCTPEQASNPSPSKDSAPRLDFPSPIRSTIANTRLPDSRRRHWGSCVRSPGVEEGLQKSALPERRCCLRYW